MTEERARFTALYKQHRRLLRHIARDYSLTPDDLLQDALVRAWATFHTFDGRNFKGWLARIMRNVAIDEARRRERQEKFSERLMVLRHTPPVDVMLCRQLNLAAARLRPRELQALQLVYVEGLEHGEVAERLGWPIGTSCSTTQRARLAMLERVA